MDTFFYVSMTFQILATTTGAHALPSFHIFLINVTCFATAFKFVCLFLDLLPLRTHPRLSERDTDEEGDEERQRQLSNESYDSHEMDEDEARDAFVTESTSIVRSAHRRRRRYKPDLISTDLKVDYRTTSDNRM